MPLASGPRKRNRLPDYDYSSIGAYFLTIRPRADILMGRVRDGKVIHNMLGSMIAKAWAEIPSHYANVGLDEYIVMPDHIHGILVMKHESNISRANYYGLIPKVVKSFKEAVTKVVRREMHEIDFKWQRSFYDHIIRDEEELNKIRKYIIENPLRWETN
jgi:REP element-mobilizing transposase RayT